MVSQPDYYTFAGQAGQLMSFQAMSSSVTFIKDTVDTVLTIYGPNGQVIAFNDDQFEPSDSSIFDVTLPSTGTYTVEVDADELSLQLHLAATQPPLLNGDSGFSRKGPAEESASY